MSNYFIPDKDIVNTILEEGTEFDGDLSFSTSLEVRGQFKGIIRSKGLVVIAKSALVEASIFSSNIVIKGIVKGDILAYNKLEIEEEGQVFGNIKTHKIKVTDGVIFEGECATLPQEALEKEFQQATSNIQVDQIEKTSVSSDLSEQETNNDTLQEKAPNTPKKNKKNP